MRLILVLLSLTTTPFILFFMTASELYLLNHEDLSGELNVLLPFLALFGVTLAGGLLLYLLRRLRPIRYLLWLYYLAGPLFLIISLARASAAGFFGRPEGIATILITLLFSAALLNQAVRPSALVKPLALIAALLWGFQLPHLFASETLTPDQETNQEEASANLPNIYHFVLDEYQTDIFELTLTPKVRESLGGFIYFPQNTTVYGRTGMSLASIFLGRSYNYETPQIDYEKAAFNSKDSILSWLKKAGYKTTAYLHKFYAFKLGLFDKIIWHKDNAKGGIKIDLTEIFFQLWLYRNTPRSLARILLPEEVLAQIEDRMLLPQTGPLLSYASFQKVLEKEEKAPGKGRYLFLHLILPHLPNVFAGGCTYTLSGSKAVKTSAEEQARCATKAVLDFVKLLKKLGRFEDSLIIIQSDHGHRCPTFDEEGKLVKVSGGMTYDLLCSWYRSRPLLLIKPAGRATTEALATSPAESTLLDLAPTIIKSIGIKTNLEFEGISLVDPIPTSLRRKRYYHFYDKESKNEWTSKMTRFIIENGEIRLDRTIQLENNPEF